MNILVSGGAGFIGSHLVKALLEQGHEVFVVDNLSSGSKQNIPPEAAFINCDLADKQLPQKLPRKCDAIFHLAAQIDVRKSVIDPVADAQTNILGTIHLLEYAKQAGVKKIIFSSTGGAIYGKANLFPTPETAETKPEAPYGVAKLSAEEYLKLYGRLFGIKTVNLRYANVYGPGQSGSKESGVIAIFTEAAAKERDLTVYGDGEQTRDFVYVEDVVAANLLALQKDQTGTFNIATGKETSLNQLIDTLKKVADKKLSVKYGPAKSGEVRRSVLDMTKAREVLGWQPQVNLEEGLKRTWEALS